MNQLQEFILHQVMVENGEQAGKKNTRSRNKVTSNKYMPRWQGIYLLESM